MRIAKYFTFLVSIWLMSSCSIFDMGFINKNDQYVPKNPRFKLKDKKGCIQPSVLDTNNIYMLVSRFVNGVQTFPNPNSTREFDNLIYFIKFYDNGRCLYFSLWNKDEAGNPNQLGELDMNPNNKNYSKDYYCINTDGKNIKIENFNYGNGYGTYLISNYKIDSTGDTLVYEDKHSKDIYIKYTIPKEWKTYKVDW